MSEDADCACRLYPAGGSDPAPLIENGAMRLIKRVVHHDAHTIEHRLECAACGKSWWVVEDDSSHWSYRGYTWTPHPPLDLI